MKTFIGIIIGIVLCLFTGFMGSKTQDLSLSEWYPTLIKSPLTPPSFVFPVTWTILYICMGISAGLIAGASSTTKTKVLIIFLLQLLFNFLWSYLFFYLRSPLYGFIDILILDIFVIWYVISSYKVKVLSSVLCWPYILWLLFATYLNGFILFRN